MELTADEVRYIATLARVGLDDAEVEQLRGELSAIIDHFAVLTEIDTEHVPPTAQSLDATNVERADVTEPSAPRDEVLSNAPRRDGPYFRVRAVLD